MLRNKLEQEQKKSEFNIPLFDANIDKEMEALHMTRLMMACYKYHDNTSEIIDLLERGANPNTTTADGICNVALHWASIRQPYIAVKALLDRGANLLAVNHYGQNAAHLSLHNVYALKALIDHAKVTGQLEKLLLQRDCDGNTPLHIAVWDLEAKSVALIMQSISPELILSLKSKHGDTPGDVLKARVKRYQQLRYDISDDMLKAITTIESYIRPGSITIEPLQQQSQKDSSNKKNESGFFLKLFNPKNPSDIKALNAIIDSEIARADEENKPLNLTHAKMVEWLKKYVNSPEFLKSYTNERSLELVAEATFWSVKLGLEPLLAKMSYSEIRKFQPLSERFLETTERTTFINDVCKKLVKPAISFEISYAIGQAAWCVYMHNNSFQKLQEDQTQYESSGLKLGR